MHKRLKDFWVLGHNLYTAWYKCLFIYIYTHTYIRLSHPMLLFYTNIKHTHNCYSCTSVSWRNSGGPICDGCWTRIASCEYHVLYRSDKLIQFLSMCKKQKSPAVWYGYNLFHEKNCCTAREMWHSERVLWVIRMLHNIAGFIGRMASLQMYSVNTPIQCLCYRPKYAQFEPKHGPIHFPLQIQINW
jgi:hypothetical protein